MSADPILTVSGPIDSCAWETFQVAVCQKGVRLLINGRLVTLEDFQRRMAELKEVLSPHLLDTLAFVQREKEVTARHLAQEKSIKMTTACMRLRRGWELGMFTREKTEHARFGHPNEYIYRVVRNTDGR